jgi:hypothetical protein
MKNIHDLTKNETIEALMTMDDNMTRLKKNEVMGNYETLKHYIGLNYELHLEHLREMRMNDIADYFEKHKTKW